MFSYHNYVVYGVFKIVQKSFKNLAMMTIKVTWVFYVATLYLSIHNPVKMPFYFQVSSLNTLFLHYFVAKKEYAMGCAQEIIRTAFNAVPDLHFLFLSVPVGTFPGKISFLDANEKII